MTFQHFARGVVGGDGGDGDCRRHRGDAGATEDTGAICQADGRSQNARWWADVHAVAGELRGRDADHLCAGDFAVSAEAVFAVTH